MVKICEMDSDDFHTKLSGSIVKIDDTIFRIDAVHSRYTEDEDEYRDEDDEPPERESPTVEGHFLSVDRTQIVWERHTYGWEELATLHDIDLSHPDVGYVNYQRSTVYVMRRAERQWKLGYNSRNVYVGNVLDEEHSHLGIYALIHLSTTDAAFVQEVFDPFYHSHIAALALIRQGQLLSAAISPHVALGQSARFPYILILYKNIPVGYVDDDNKWFLFETADYVNNLLPVRANIKEDLEDVIVRSEWG